MGGWQLGLGATDQRLHTQHPQLHAGRHVAFTTSHFSRTGKRPARAGEWPFCAYITDYDFGTACLLSAQLGQLQLYPCTCRMVHKYAQRRGPYRKL